jgi:hypothetical protein
MIVIAGCMIQIGKPRDRSVSSPSISSVAGNEINDEATTAVAEA